ncbi:MAG: endonuclease III domain-containing protein [Candidatus Eisenbacteria bacterium]|nr:endonuclease III domain-containing protein [Candidatus Eisenbacteria bacterium]
MRVRAAPRGAASLLALYEALREDHGTLGWWPGRTRLEIIVGAILTQNTAWTNVEKAIAALRARGWLKLPDLARVPEEDLAAAIRPSGYFRQKAKKIRAFLEVLERRHGGSLARMAQRPTDELREELLGIWGIGPETADSILLYAFGRPVFVVDAYTHRLLHRHDMHPGGGYEHVRAWFGSQIPESAELYNDFHAQIVWVGKERCRTRPRCEGCPLERFLPAGGPLLEREK